MDMVVHEISCLIVGCFFEWDPVCAAAASQCPIPVHRSGTAQHGLSCCLHAEKWQKLTPVTESRPVPNWLSKVANHCNIHKQTQLIQHSPTWATQHAEKWHLVTDTRTNIYFVITTYYAFFPRYFPHQECHYLNHHDHHFPYHNTCPYIYHKILAHNAFTSNSLRLDCQ